MKILICVNPKKDKDFVVYEKIASFLDKRGVSYSKCVLVKKDSGFDESEAENCDIVLVLGGDGTLMRVAKKSVKFKLPIIGVNTGHLGFLAQTGIEGLENTMERLISGEYLLEKRMMLKGTVLRNKEVIFETNALNDVCINRGGPLQILNYSVSVNDMLLKSYSADGVIISTPTGSTGYNLSAGGPIVEPSADMILLTPVCAHTFMNRSILFKSKDTVTITIGEPHDDDIEQKVIASFDGNEKIELLCGDEIRIEKADEKIEFIQMNNVNFLETLNRKLKENQ